MYSTQKLLSKAIALAVPTAMVVGSVGCETKSFIDPSEVGRYEKTPLVVPILDSLVISLQAEEEIFAQARDVTSADLVVENTDYEVGPNDLLQIRVQDLLGPGAESVEVKRVTERGRVSLPYIDPIEVKGLSEAEIEEAVARAYADKEILPDAQVSVAVLEAQNRLFSVTGAVQQPGPYGLPRADFRLLDAMTVARGANSEVGIDYIYIIRQRDGSAPAAPAQPAPQNGPPTTPGVDPLMPQSRRPAGAPRTSALNTSMIVEPSSIEEARANAEMQLVALRTAMQDVQQDPLAPATEPAPAAEEPAPVMPPDRVIEIEGAPAAPVEPAPVPVPLSPAPEPASEAVPLTGAQLDATTEPFEFETPDEPGDREVIRVPFDELRRGALRFNVVIKPNDMIFVPQPPFGIYYMGGHVQRTGVYSIPPSGITLKQAVISAGMLDAVAIPARTDIIRRVGADKEVFVRVDLERIASGLEPDVFLKPNDSIMVGTNAGAPFLAAIRNGFRITYGFGFLYDRNYAPRIQR